MTTTPATAAREHEMAVMPRVVVDAAAGQVQKDESHDDDDDDDDGDGVLELLLVVPRL